MEKIFTEYNEIRNNALKIGKKIVEEGFVPDVIYIPLRGGAYMGNVLSEFFKLYRKKVSGRPVFYAAVVARSYSDVRQRDKVMIDGWTYDPRHLRHGDKVMFIDDIFDSGMTLNHLVDEILQYGIPREDIKIVVHDYKEFAYRDQLPLQPDYYCRKFEIPKPEEDVWIHYLSHELMGLSKEELEARYFSQDDELRGVFDFLGLT